MSDNIDILYMYIQWERLCNYFTTISIKDWRVVYRLLTAPMKTNYRLKINYLAHVLIKETDIVKFIKLRCIVGPWWIVNGDEDDLLFCTYLKFVGSVSHWSFDHCQYHIVFFDSNKLLHPTAIHSILTIPCKFYLAIFVTSPVYWW